MKKFALLMLAACATVPAFCNDQAEDNKSDDIATVDAPEAPTSVESAE